MDSDHLVLEASAAPPDAVLEALSRHKAEIVILLQPGNNRWAGEDCHSLDHEHTGTASNRATVETETTGISWAEWKAAELNGLFHEQGLTAAFKASAALIAAFSMSENQLLLPQIVGGDLHPHRLQPSLR